jgi:hypothetical protein
VRTTARHVCGQGLLCLGGQLSEQAFAIRLNGQTEWGIHAPLHCMHQYRASTYDPADGWVDSPVIWMPLCPVS